MIPQQLPAAWVYMLGGCRVGFGCVAIGLGGALTIVALPIGVLCIPRGIRATRAHMKKNGNTYATRDDFFEGVEVVLSPLWAGLDIMQFGVQIIRR